MKTEKQELIKQYSDLENKIIDEIANTGNDKLMDMFLDWQKLREKLNKDWMDFFKELDEKIEQKKAETPANLSCSICRYFCNNYHHHNCWFETEDVMKT